MKEIVFGLCVIVVAAATFLTAQSFPPELAVEGGVGPAFFPQVVAILLALLGAALVISAMKKGRAAQQDDAGESGHNGAVAVAFLVIVGYAAALHFIGFPIGTFLFLIVMISLYLSPFRWGRVAGFALPVAVAITAASYGLFETALGIPLPRGALF